MSGSPSQLSKRLFEKRLSDDQTESGKPRKANGKLSFQLETCRKAVQLSELSTTYKVESGKPVFRPHSAYQEFRAAAARVPKEGAMPEPSEYDLCAAFHALRHAMIFLMSRLSSADQQEIVRTCRKTATADECALAP